MFIAYTLHVQIYYIIYIYTDGQHTSMDRMWSHILRPNDYIIYIVAAGKSLLYRNANSVNREHNVVRVRVPEAANLQTTMSEEIGHQTIIRGEHKPARVYRHASTHADYTHRHIKVRRLSIIGHFDLNNLRYT